MLHRLCTSEGHLSHCSVQGGLLTLGFSSLCGRGRAVVGAHFLLFSHKCPQPAPAHHWSRTTLTCQFSQAVSSAAVHGCQWGDLCACVISLSLITLCHFRLRFKERREHFCLSVAISQMAVCVQNQNNPLKVYMVFGVP